MLGAVQAAAHDAFDFAGSSGLCSLPQGAEGYAASDPGDGPGDSGFWRTTIAGLARLR